MPTLRHSVTALSEPQSGEEYINENELLELWNHLSVNSQDISLRMRNV